MLTRLQKDLVGEIERVKRDLNSCKPGTENYERAEKKFLNMNKLFNSLFPKGI